MVRHRRTQRATVKHLVEQLESRVLLAGYTYQMQHWFSGSDGAYPESPLVFDAQGNAFGATLYGGAQGKGALFEISSDGTFTTLYSFSGGADGAIPIGHLVLDDDGNLLGTAGDGGNNNKGVIFSLAISSSALTVVHAFTGADGADPAGGLTRDSGGNLFGTTLNGGSKSNGTIFTVSSDGTFSTLHSFLLKDGTNPYSGVAIDADGSLYGTTQANGPSRGGTVYKFTPGTGTLTVLYSSSRTSSLNGVIVDEQHNVFGTTEYGGTFGAGTVFQINSGGAFNVLWNFSKADGYPWGDLLLDSQRNLFGTTLGGAVAAPRTQAFGTAWVIPASSSTLSVLHQFNNNNGRQPSTGLTLNADGDLFGLTQFGGPAGVGTVFELTTTPATTSATKTLFQQQPGTGQAGRALNPFTVALADSANTVAPFAFANVTLAIQSGPAGAKITGGKVVPAQNGVATFTDVRLSKPGTYTLVASSGTLATSVSSSFTVTAPATHLVFGAMPTTTSAGQTIGPFVVYVMDAASQVVTHDASLVTISSTANGASLTGTLTVQAVNGVATFYDVHFSRAGTLVLQAKVKGLTTGKSTAITIVPDVSTRQLFLKQRPATNVKANAVLAPAIIIVVRDAYGNVFKDDQSSMTLSISSGPVGGVISKGTTTVSAVAGQAKFTNIALSISGSYLLHIVDTTLGLELDYTQNIV